MNFGYQNIQDIRTKETEVFMELKAHNIEVAVLSETKKKGNEIDIKGNYIHFSKGVQKEKTAKAGVSIAVNKGRMKQVKEQRAINERLITLDIKFSTNTIKLRRVQASTNHSTVEIKENFYDQLKYQLRYQTERK